MSEENTELQGDALLDEIDNILIPSESEQEIPPAKVDESQDEPDESQDVEETDDNADQQDESDESEIDYKQMIPLADGRDPVSIGDMKDAYNAIERDKSDVDSRRMDLIAKEQELNSYLSSAGVEIPPEFKQHMAKQQAAHLEQQHDMMLDMMPELKDKAVFEKTRGAIVEAAKGSNFSAQEISQISDARVIHLLNRLATLETEKAKAAESAIKLKSKPVAKGHKPRLVSKKNTNQQFENAVNSSDRGVKDAAIDALLGM